MYVDTRPGPEVFEQVDGVPSAPRQGSACAGVMLALAALLLAAVVSGFGKGNDSGDEQLDED